MKFYAQSVNKVFKDMIDKQSKEQLNFVVVTLLEYNRKTKFPTGKVREKYVKLDSELYTKNNNFEIGLFYDVEVDFTGKIEDIALVKS